MGVTLVKTLLKRKRLPRVLFAAAFVFAVFFAPLYTWLGPRSYVSYYEQRRLATRPEITWEGLWDGQVFTDAETFYADHFTFRDNFVRLNMSLDLALKRPVVKDIVVYSDALLSFHGFKKWDTAYLTELAEKAGADYKDLSDDIRSFGGYFCYLGLPLQSSYFAAKYPDYMDSREWHVDGIRAAFSKAMEENGVPFIDMHAIYDSMGTPDDFYFDSDHHYTFKGAFAAYTELINRINSDTGLNVEVLAESDLDFKTLPNPYLGSTNRKLYGLWPTKDKLEIALPRTTVEFSRTDNGVPVEASLFALPENDSDTVTYLAYMGGDIGETIIDTNRPELPDILIFGDSFTNPLETLLWYSFNRMYSLDLRYYNAKSLREYIDMYKPDVVICVRDETVYLSTDGNGAVARS